MSLGRLAQQTGSAGEIRRSGFTVDNMSHPADSRDEVEQNFADSVLKLRAASAQDSFGGQDPPGAIRAGSALTGERAPKVLETIDRVAAARLQRVPTAQLNRFVAEVTAAHPPASPGRREVRILYAAQTSVAPPTFVFFTNVATSFHFSYTRFLENRLRESFGLEGTPIRIQVRRRAK